MKGDGLNVYKKARTYMYRKSNDCETGCRPKGW